MVISVGFAANAAFIIRDSTKILIMTQVCLPAFTRLLVIGYWLLVIGYWL